MAHDLAGRIRLLRQLRDSRLTRPSTADEEPESGPSPQTGPIPVAEQTSATPPAGFSALADGVWGRVIRLAAPQLAQVVRRGSVLLPAADDAAARAASIRFFDLETTGLSGGAGTKVFLAGVGVLEEETLRVEQLLLADLGAEPAFLDQLALRFPEDALYVSYNGRAFDAHQLKTRFLMNRRVHSLQFHVDLLYPARRLWRSVLSRCSLAELERSVLSIRREADLPSAEVPERYFAYLRNRDPAALEPVFAHHYHDIVSLSWLFITMDEILRRPCAWLARSEVPFDAVQAAVWLLSHPRAADRRFEAEELLNAVLRDEDRASDERVEAGLLLGTCHKRAARPHEAEQVYRLLYETFRDPRVAVELAKQLEHHRRDPAGALEVLEAVDLQGCPRGVTDDIEYRTQRLLRKRDRGRALHG